MFHPNTRTYRNLGYIVTIDLQFLSSCVPVSGRVVRNTWSTSSRLSFQTTTRLGGEYSTSLTMLALAERRIRQDQTQATRKRHEASLLPPADATNIRVRVPLSNVANIRMTTVMPLPSGKQSLQPKCPAADQPFVVSCDLGPEATGALHGPVIYLVHLRCRLNGAAWTVRRRFSEFDAMHWRLVKAEKHFYLPMLPPKHAIGIRRQPLALLERAEALSSYSTEMLTRPDLIMTDDVSNFFELSRGLWREDPESSEDAKHLAAQQFQRVYRRRAARTAAQEATILRRQEAARYCAVLKLQSAHRRLAAGKAAIHRLISIFTLQA